MFYLDDIVLIVNDGSKIFLLKKYPWREFEIKDLDHLRYFFGVHIAWFDKGMFAC